MYGPDRRKKESWLLERARATAAQKGSQKMIVGGGIFPRGGQKAIEKPSEGGTVSFGKSNKKKKRNEWAGGGERNRSWAKKGHREKNRIQEQCVARGILAAKKRGGPTRKRGRPPRSRTSSLKKKKFGGGGLPNGEKKKTKGERL